MQKCRFLLAKLKLEQEARTLHQIIPVILGRILNNLPIIFQLVVFENFYCNIVLIAVLVCRVLVHLRILPNWGATIIVSNWLSIIHIPIRVHIYASIQQISIIDAASHSTALLSNSDVFGTACILASCRKTFQLLAQILTNKLISAHCNQLGISGSPLLNRVDELLSNALHLNLVLLEEEIVAVGFKIGVCFFGNQNFLVGTLWTNSGSFVDGGSNKRKLGFGFADNPRNYLPRVHTNLELELFTAA